MIKVHKFKFTQLVFKFCNNNMQIPYYATTIFHVVYPLIYLQLKEMLLNGNA